MRLRSSLLPALLAFASAALAPHANAQFGLYGTVTVQDLGGIQSSPQRQTNTSYNAAIDPLGGTVGLYYDFRNIGPVRLGVDARFVDLTSTRGAQTTANAPGSRVESGLGGVRASFHTPIDILHPYAQASAGIGRSDYGVLRNAAGAVVLQNNFEYHIYAGADLRLFPLLDFRVIELGYGGLNPFGANAHNYPLRSISTGLVVHFPHLP